MKKNISGLLTGILLLAFSPIVVFSQTKNQDTFLEKINYLDFLEIKISYNAERYKRNEINVIYLQNNSVNIHSILRSSSPSEKQIDTVFTLNSQQITKLEKFEGYFSKNTFPSNVIFAGTKTNITIALNGVISSKENKNNYSLLLDFLME
jgi:hypothetical protein